jgi:hypothetical protein
MGSLSSLPSHLVPFGCSVCRKDSPLGVPSFVLQNGTNCQGVVGKSFDPFRGLRAKDFWTPKILLIKNVRPPFDGGPTNIQPKSFLPFGRWSPVPSLRFPSQAHHVQR